MRRFAQWLMGLKKWCGEVFEQSEVLIFIGACGIAVRTIAPFVNNKCTDPAVFGGR